VFDKIMFGEIKTSDRLEQTITACTVRCICFYWVVRTGVGWVDRGPWPL